MPRPKKPDQDSPFSIRIPPALLERIKSAAARLGISDAELIRLCASIGLEHLARIDYDLAKAVCDAEEKKRRAGGLYISGTEKKSARLNENP